MEEIEPHPDLIRYFEAASRFSSRHGVDHFFSKGEHYNIVSDIERNIFLIRRLESAGLLSDENHVCDCGMGLGNALFDIYLQSFDSESTFRFTGIEKQDEYLDFFNKHLSTFWEGNLNLIHGDIMSQDYSTYNFVYCYSPFNCSSKLDDMYSKIASEIIPGSFILEHANHGLGHLGRLQRIDGLVQIDIGGQAVFQKR